MCCCIVISQECNSLGQESGIQRNSICVVSQDSGVVSTRGLNKVKTHENSSDMLTKPVTRDKFKYCLELLHVLSY